MSLLAVVAASAVVTTSASATKYVDSYIGNPTSSTASGAGGIFNSPRGVAVNDGGTGGADAGDVYVVDGAKNRIQQFDADGGFVRAWGRDVVSTGQPNNVSTTAFEVCDTTTVPANVAAHCKNGTTGGLGGELNSPQGVAVDQSSGHVYVTDGSNLRVQEFTATGQFVRAWGQDVVQPGGTGETFIAVNEQQTVSLSGPFDLGCFCPGPVTGGTFTLTFDGQVTGPIPYNAPATGDTTAGIDSVQEALEGLSNVASGDVSVTGASGGTWTVEFRGVLAGDDQPQMTGAAGALTPAGSSVSVATTVQGGPAGGFEVCELAAECKAGVSGQIGGSFGSAFSGYPAVVPSGAADAGDVVVADPGNRRVQQFTPAGGFVHAFGGDVDGAGGAGGFEVCTAALNCKAGAGGSGVGQFATLAPARVAVDAAGAIYATEPTFTGSANFRVQKFTPQAGPPALDPAVFVPAVLSAGSSTDGLAPSEIAFDAVNNRILVVKGSVEGSETCANGSPSPQFERRVLEVTPAGTLADTHMTCAGFSLGASVSGLAAAPSSGRLYVSSTSNSNISGSRHRVYMLDDDGATPSIATVDAPLDVTADSAELAGSVNPNSAPGSDFGTAWELQVSRNGTTWTSVGSGSLPAGTTAQPVTATATGLLPNTTYRVRVLTRKPFANPDVASPEQTLLTDSIAPSVNSTAVDSVTQTSARLKAQINPHSTPTGYRFEWGTQTGHYPNHLPIPDAPLGSGPDQLFASKHLAGLSPGTTYYFRAVATSATDGTTTGPERSFTTRTTPPPGLANRAYELVSPAYKIGGGGIGVWYIDQRTTYLMGVAATEGERFGSNGDSGQMLLDGAQAYGNDWAFADRVDGQQGWVSHSPFTHPATSAQLAKFVYIHSATDDLSRLAWRTNNNTIGIFPETLDWPGAANPSFMGSWEGRWEIFGPNVVDPVGAGQLPSPFPGIGGQTCDVAFSGDGSRAVCSTNLHTNNLPFLRGLAGPNDPTSTAFGDLVGGRSVYVGDSSGELADNFPDTGPRTLVNVCSPGTEIPNVDGSANLAGQGCVDQPDRDDLVSSRGATTVDVEPESQGGVRGTPENVVSEDGSRIFFMSPDPLAAGVPNGTSAFCTGSGAATVCPTQLFVRQDNGDGTFTTRWISKAVDGLFGSQDASLTGTVRFERATADGDKVLFRTNSPLTADDRNGTGAAPVTAGNASNQSWDLYLYDFPDDSGADPGDGHLTRVSAGPDGDGDCNVQPDGSSSGVSGSRHMSEDGARIVLTCAAPLPNVPTAGSGTITEPAGTSTTTTEANLYSFDAGRPTAERYRFIARIPRSTSVGVANCAGAGVGPTAPLNGGSFGTLLSNCVRGTADGSFVTFWTAGRLTGDDPNTTTADIYGYDTDTDELTRISAPQGGVGGTYACGTNTAQQCYADNGYDYTEGTRTRAPKPALGVATEPLVAGDRMAFFQSKSRLVAEDVDDQMDVYQWRNGELSLLSTGKSDTHGAFYKGNDKTGRNVYMVTQDRLSWQDTDDVFDAYTARVGGGISQPVPPAVCNVLAGGCDGPGAAPVSVQPKTAPSAETPSAGNVSPGARMSLAVRKPSMKARRRAARSGVLAVRIRTSRAGVVRVLARAKIGKRTRRVAGRKVRVDEAGVVTVELRLNRAAKRRLRSGRRLNLSIQARSSGARSRTATVRLKRGPRS